jgi:hypothetical protein
MPPNISGDLLRPRSRLAPFSICEDLSANEIEFRRRAVYYYEPAA